LTPPSCNTLLIVDAVNTQSTRQATYNVDNEIVTVNLNHTNVECRYMNKFRKIVFGIYRAYTGNDESEFESRFPTNLHTICNNGLCKEYEAFTNIVRGVTPLAMYLQLINFMYRGHLYPEYIRR
tara:strand:- start:44 stop:415 length:372 start_codon:yes stop_codon:yes gene_type:complete